MSHQTNVDVDPNTLYPHKFEQHWRENVADLLHGMRRFVPKLDMDIAEAEYVELLRCEHLLKEFYPTKYIALKRQKVHKDADDYERHLSGVLFHIIQNADDTTLAYKIPAALNELVSLKKSKEVFEDLQINSTKHTSHNGSFADQNLYRKEYHLDHAMLDPRDLREDQRELKEKYENTRDIYERPSPSIVMMPSTKSKDAELVDDKSRDSLKDQDWTMVPFDEYMKMRSTIDFQKSKIAELTNRLSIKGASKSDVKSDETNHILDADNEHRPSRLAERFAEIFTNEWSRAYEAFTRRLHWREVETIFQLLRIVRYAYDFCETTAKDQLDELENVISCPIIHPKGRFEEDVIFDKITARQKEKLSGYGRKCSREYRKHVAELSVPEVCKDFKEHIVEQVFKWKIRDLPDQVVEFINHCTEVLWFMCIHEPPMVITWANDGESVNSNYYEFYARRGNVVRQAVWPAVFLHHGGPLLTRGAVLAETFTGR